MKSTTTWAIDPVHSEVLFKVKHLVISTVTGSFKKFRGTVITEGEDFENAKIDFAMDVRSIDTNQPIRDKNLQNSDFFDSENYPEIGFQSASFTRDNGNDFKMTGNLTIKGVTRSIQLNVEYGGAEKDIHGNLKHGFELTGKINRKDFGMTSNAITETGGIVLGDEIRMIANIQVAQAVEQLMMVS